MKYREKNAHSTPCTARECSDTATKLLLMSGKPWWVCDEHYSQFKTQERQRA